MSQQAPRGFTYDLDTITRNAPPVSGVYAIYSHETCVYVGEGDDVCSGLLEIFFEANPCLAERQLTHFTCEVTPPEARLGRKHEQIHALAPMCNLGTGSPKCRDCRLAQGSEGDGLVRVANAF
ncbi:MAG TPA: hypothetical protein VLH58_12335 [Candidatus Methylomirabilis sp.]|nr:hypothetical protein [Candidatus Methylomirabilis sp.]